MIINRNVVLILENIVLLKIIIVFSLIALPNQHKVDPRRAKKASSIENGNLCTSVFPNTCAWDQQE